MITSNEVIGRLQTLKEILKKSAHIYSIVTIETDFRDLRFNLTNPNDIRRYNSLLYLTELIEKNVLENNVVTKRDLFYQNVELFNNQGNVDKLIKLLGYCLATYRFQLNIISGSKGLIIGNCYIKYSAGDVTIVNDVRTTLIPSRIDIVHEVKCKEDIRFVVIVEKEAIFHKLVESRFARLHQCIIVTGIGMPNYSTKAFLVKLRESNENLKFFALMDADIFGLEIYLNYKYGETTFSLQKFRSTLRRANSSSLQNNNNNNNNGNLDEVAMKEIYEFLSLFRDDFIDDIHLMLPQLQLIGLTVNQIKEICEEKSNIWIQLKSIDYSREKNSEVRWECRQIKLVKWATTNENDNWIGAIKFVETDKITIQSLKKDLFNIGKKCELEALDAISPDFLHQTYLPALLNYHFQSSN